MVRVRAAAPVTPHGMVVVAFTLCVCSVLSVARGGGEFSGPIEHVVVLMLENRAFDHMCGFFPGVNGLKGTESNPVNTSEPTGARVTVQKSSPYIGPFDPDHSTPATTSKIFGQACEGRSGCKPTMDGFIEFARKRHTLNQSESLMNMFTPDRVPVMASKSNKCSTSRRLGFSNGGNRRDLRCVLHPSLPSWVLQLGAKHVSDPDSTIKRFN